MNRDYESALEVLARAVLHEAHITCRDTALFEATPYVAFIAAVFHVKHLQVDADLRRKIKELDLGN